MELAELDAGFNPQIRSNDGLTVRFFNFTDKDEEETAKQGRPIYKDYVYIRVLVAGDRGNVLERPATEQDFRRFAHEYKAFKASEEPKSVGIPLSEWSGVNKSQIEEFKFFNIHTVEQLAGVSDANAQKFPGIVALQQKAKAYLALLVEKAPVEKLQAELSARDARISQLEQDLADVVAELKTFRSAKTYP